jgi:hypothetical protein
MSQADFTIANQTFPNTRAELNTSLQALATNSAGNSAPSTTFANQWWFDSDGNQLYMRNKDNDAWVKVLTIGATSDEVDSIGENIFIDSSGNVGIGTSSIDVITQAGGSGYTVLQLENNEGGQINLDHTDAGTGSTLGMINFNRAGETVAHIGGVTDGATDSGHINFRTQPASGALTERMRITSTGTVGIGTTSPSQTLSVAGNMDISATSRLYLDGGGNTFISEVSADTINITTNNTERMRIHSGGNISIGSTSDPAKLSVTTASSSVSPSSSADELLVEGSGNSGITIGSGASNGGNIYFGDTNSNNQGIINYDHGTDALKFGAGAAIKARILSGGEFSMGDASPNVSAGGICLNQGSADGEIMTFKSDSVAHGMTAQGQTDDYFHIQKASGSAGGVEFKSLTEATHSMYFSAFNTSVGSGSAHSADANMMFQASVKSGTSISNLDVNDNIAIFRNHSNAQLIIKGDGELFSNETATIQVFDEYDDAQLIRSFDLSKKQTAKGFIDSKYDKFIKYNHETLAQANLVGREEDGTPNHFVNITGMQRLHNGAIWQQYEKTEKLVNAMYELAKTAVGEEKANEILKQNEIKLLN